MSERAEKIGGAFSMISAPGQGTEIVVRVGGQGPPESRGQPAVQPGRESFRRLDQLPMT